MCIYVNRQALQNDTFCSKTSKSNIYNRSDANRVWVSDKSVKWKYLGDNIKKEQKEMHSPSHINHIVTSYRKTEVQHSVLGLMVNYLKMSAAVEEKKG